MDFIRNANESMSTQYKIHIQPYVNRLTRQKHVRVALDFFSTYLHTFARLLICCYFINQSFTNFCYWYYYRVPGIPWAAFMEMPFAFLVAIYRPKNLTYVFCLVLAALALKDAVFISWHQVSEWMFQGKELYINELMVKKFSMLGAIMMVVVNDRQFKQKLDNSSKALAGLIVNEETTKSPRMHILLLVVRLLISSLFIFVGYSEIKRQLVWSSGVTHHGHKHVRAAGDGHNEMWLKVLEFFFALPFSIGLKTKLVSNLLALTLFLEAMIYWQFWNTVLGIWYAIHAREHFSVNMGVMGGLLFLQRFGPGKYSVDELIKKKQ